MRGIDTKNIKYKLVRSAFTLAEVLIVIGIIGIIAEMTIPTLMNNIQDAQFKTAMKKNYSIFSNLYTLIQADGDTFQGSVSSCADRDHTCFKNILKTKLSYIKECDGGSIQGSCFSKSDNVTYLSGVTADTGFLNLDQTAGLVLKDGTMVDIFFDSASCNQTRGVYPDDCGWVTVDVNGLNKPNRIGRDIYTFIFYKDRVRPLGTQGDGFDGPTECTKAGTGRGCTAYYLQNN